MVNLEKKREDPCGPRKYRRDTDAPEKEINTRTILFFSIRASPRGATAIEGIRAEL
jgi:hypothetical protein